MQGVLHHLSPRGALRLRALFRPARGRLRPRDVQRGRAQAAHPGRPRTLWRYADFLPLERVPRTLAADRLDPARARRPARRAPRPRRAVDQERDRQPDPLVQGPRRLVALARAIELGFDTIACASTGNLANAVAASAAAAGLPASSSSRRTSRTKDPPGRRLGTTSSGSRPLRRREPPVPRAHRRARRLGIGELNCGRFTPRAPRRSPTRSWSSSLGAPRARRGAARLGLAVHQDPEGLRGLRGARADRQADARHRRPGGGLLADREAFAAGHFAAGPAGHDRQSLAIGSPADGRYGVEIARRTGGAILGVEDAETAPHPAACRDGGNLHRDRGRRDARDAAKLAERGAVDPRRARRPSSPATA